ncbi:ATP-binding protein [Arcicella rigui]|uniref:Uncharacterized protein n=1 Tax=Arcicella rigui TaxID=797020 RepID=A0ABU5QD56_9BACT|nr:hypothetical protein [Arcicella rigui]MEA5140548.1 hypothetical protein [Arcicella rigui]
MSDRKHTYLFNPPQKDPRVLKAEFVVRTAIFEEIFSDIQSDSMQKPPQHYMLLGQRGMGKTTMLLRLKYAIEDDASLNKWLLPIIFNEEQYAMPDLASFFEHIATLLAEDHPAYEKLLDAMRVHEYEQDYEQKAYEILAAWLKENQQKIIVFHDNFGQFLEKIGKISTHRLRNILMNSSEIRLVGASATLLEHTSNYNKPFFDFFYQIRLRGLNADETILLFERLAENEGKTAIFAEILKTERPRIDVMRKLSGGVIRTMVMLFDVFMDNEKQDSFKDLEAILDRVTPLYKHRMDDLKPQQQLIVDAVAKAWDAVTVSEIAEIARAGRQGLKTNQISAQLKQLVDNQIIEIEPRTTGRTNLYRLQERFFNIWYLMRYSTRQDKQRVIWLVKFLEGWCDIKDLKELFDRFDNNLEKGTYELNTVFDRALAYSMVNEKDTDLIDEKDKLLRNAIKHLEKNQFEEKLISLLKEALILNSSIRLQKAISQFKPILSKAYSVAEPILKKSKYGSFCSIEIEAIKKIVQENTYDLEVFPFIYSIWSFLYLELDNLDESIKISKNVFLYLNQSKKYSDINKTSFQNYLLILCSKKQYHSVLSFFEEIPELKDHLKPIYFLTMEYLKDEYPNEYLKAGEEYRETIEELKARVKWFEEHLN